MPKGNYDNYYDKVTAYVSILTGPTWSIDPGLTAKTFAIFAGSTFSHAAQVIEKQPSFFAR